MSLNNLPEEVLIRILLHLTPSERLNCALVCRRMAQVFKAPELMEGVQLDIAGFEMKKAVSVLSETYRPYRNLRVYKAKLPRCDSRFWGTIGRTIRELELSDCSWSSMAFYKILGRCPVLESLKIRGEPPIKDFELPKKTEPRRIRASLMNIRHLELDVDFPGELLVFLLVFMPSISSLSLHEGRFCSLDFLFFMLMAHTDIKWMDFNHMKLDDKRFTEIVEACSDRLQELRLRCNHLTERSYAALSSFTELRHLSLRGDTSRIRDIHLKQILINAPHLETLAIDDCSNLTNDGFSVPHKLKHLELRNFHFSPSDPGMMLSDRRSIWVLHTLDLKSVNVNDSEMRSLACLTNLRELSLDSQLSPGFLDVVVENLKKLEKLFLGPTAVMTDRDGVNLCRLKQLKKLQILEGIGSTDRTLERGIGSSMMEYIWISGCALTDTGLASIAAHHGRLKDVTLSRCGRITVSGLVDFLRREPQLRAFTFYCNVRFGDELLRRLQGLCPRLRYLVLRRQKNTAAVERFKKMRPCVQLSIGRFGACAPGD